MILNIAAYLFVAIDDADALAVRLRERAEADALRGSMLVTPEGLNLFLAGAEAPLCGFLDWLRDDPRFASLHAKESWSETIPFAKLKVKRKDEIIAFRREHASPLDTGARAPAVEPATLQRWIAQGYRDDAGKRLVLLDTRNREEFGFGTFKASARAAREGKNPKTGEKIKIAATTVPKFSAGASFKTAVAAPKKGKK